MVDGGWYNEHCSEAALPGLQLDWQAAWRKSLKLNYDPGVWVRTLSPAEPVEGVLRYICEPAKLVNDHKFFLEMDRQIERRNFVSSTGVVRQLLARQEQERKASRHLRNEKQCGPSVVFYYDGCKEKRFIRDESRASAYPHYPHPVGTFLDAA